MAIKVVFGAGASSATVAGLYQWDYGQALEIECTEIGSEVVEVHFACTGMNEAIVRPCTFSNGIGSVIIPDRCLEQTSSITAWIYKVDSTQGHTIKTITLPITARTRPSKSHDIPTEYVDKYADLITEINEVVNNIEQGNITVAKAVSADKATSATTAVNAQSASYATSAGRATTADNATNATRAKNADNATYATSAGSASSASKATTLDVGSAKSYTIAVDGVNGKVSLTNNTFYLVVVLGNDGINRSGILFYTSSSSFNKAALDYEYEVSVSNSGSCVVTKGGAANPAGTIKFYKLGEV